MIGSSLVLHERASELIDGELRASVYGSMEELAHYLFVECPDFHERDAGYMAQKTGISVKVFRALSYDSRWRTIVSKMISLDVVDYKEERANIGEMNKLVTQAEKDADKIRAYQVVAQQTGTKLPERTEVENVHRVEIVQRRLKAEVAGYTPRTPYQAPVSKRALVRPGSHAEEASDRLRPEVESRPPGRGEESRRRTPVVEDQGRRHPAGAEGGRVAENPDTEGIAEDISDADFRPVSVYERYDPMKPG